MENLNIVQVDESTNKKILSCVLLTVAICGLLYFILKNRTVEVENFTNQSVLYSSNGKTIERTD